MPVGPTTPFDASARPALHEATRNLHAALKALEGAQAMLLEARALLTAAGSGSIPASVDAGTFNALFEITRGRDGDGEPEPDGRSVIERLSDLLSASAEQDDAARRVLRLEVMPLNHGDRK
jgi:hypothetical protein